MYIALVGMPGAGKSYLGKMLADKLHFVFVDVDALLEKKFKKKLQEILNDLGEKRFLQEEAGMVLGLKSENGMIISPGGSIVYSADAMRHLKKISKIVFLNVSLPILKTRIVEKSRGIVGIENKTLEDLYKERFLLYKEYADFVIDDGGVKTADDIVYEIMAK